MPSPRTPRGQAMGATNQAMPSPRTPRGQAMGATNQAMPSPRTPRGQAMGATNRPRLAALDRVRETDDVHRAATSRVSTSNSNRHLLPHVGVSPRTAGSRRQLTPMEPIRSAEISVGLEYVPLAPGMRMQDIVPEYERSNPLWVKMETTYGALSEHKHALLQAFQKIDQNGTGALSKKDFAKGLRDVDQTCKLSTPRVLLDDMIEEAAHMFCPERNPSDPQDVVYYKDFVSALQRPSPRPHQTVEELCESSRPAARMARTARFIERHRQHDFSLFERMKAHIIQNDLRSLLSLRRGLDPGSGTRETFLRLDADRDGVIGKQDLRQRLLDLGMPVRDENLELILSYCGTEKRGGIDFPAFVKSFEANGRGWFHPFNPHKRLPSPPFRLRADQTSPAYAKTPPSRKPAPEGTGPEYAGYITQGYQVGPDVAMIDTSILQRQHRTHQRRAKARRKFSEYEAARREMQEQALASSPLRKTVPLLMKDYQAEVAANVQRERDSLVPAIC